MNGTSVAHPSTGKHLVYMQQFWAEWTIWVAASLTFVFSWRYGLTAQDGHLAGFIVAQIALAVVGGGWFAMWRTGGRSSTGGND